MQNKNPLIWEDECSVLIHSSRNGIFNCLVDSARFSSGATATAVLGFQRKMRPLRRRKGGGAPGGYAHSVSFNDGHLNIPLTQGQRTDSDCSSEDSHCSGTSTPDMFLEDSHGPLYIRPAIRPGIQPFKPKSLGESFTDLIKKSFTKEEKWEALQELQQQDESRHSHLSFSVSVISGADTAIGEYKSPEASFHGDEFEVESGQEESHHGCRHPPSDHPFFVSPASSSLEVELPLLPACANSAVLIKRNREIHIEESAVPLSEEPTGDECYRKCGKTFEELNAELLAEFQQALQNRTVRLVKEEDEVSFTQQEATPSPMLTVKRRLLQGLGCLPIKALVS